METITEETYKESRLRFPVSSRASDPEDVVSRDDVDQMAQDAFNDGAEFALETLMEALEDNSSPLNMGIWDSLRGCLDDSHGNPEVDDVMSDILFDIRKAL